MPAGAVKLDPCFIAHRQINFTVQSFFFSLSLIIYCLFLPEYDSLLKRLWWRSGASVQEALPERSGVPAPTARGHLEPINYCVGAIVASHLSVLWVFFKL